MSYYEEKTSQFYQPPFTSFGSLVTEPEANRNGLTKCDFSKRDSVDTMVKIIMNSTIYDLVENLDAY